MKYLLSTTTALFISLTCSMAQVTETVLIGTNESNLQETTLQDFLSEFDLSNVPSGFLKEAGFELLDFSIFDGDSTRTEDDSLLIYPDSYGSVYEGDENLTQSMSLTFEDGTCFTLHNNNGFWGFPVFSSDAIIQKLFLLFYARQCFICTAAKHKNMLCNRGKKSQKRSDDSSFCCIWRSS
jgi:hypothetical protein